MNWKEEILRSLINNDVNNSLNNIIGECFALNRLCDRGMSELAVKFAMNNTVNLAHPRIAHIFPKIADVISDYQGDRDAISGYPETPLDETDYATPTSFFERLLDGVTDLESLCYDVLSKAQDDSDITTVVFLQSFINLLIPITGQCLLLVDKCELYANNWAMFDADAELFITLPIMTGKG
jgi:hypothetical protein